MGLLGTRTRRERVRHVGVVKIRGGSCVWYAASWVVFIHVVHWVP